MDWRTRFEKVVITIVVMVLFLALAGAYQRLAVWRDLPAHRAVQAPQIMLSVLGESLLDFSDLQIMQLNDVPVRMYTGLHAANILAYDHALERFLAEGWSQVPLDVDLEEMDSDVSRMALLEGDERYAVLLVREGSSDGSGVFMHAEIPREVVDSFEAAMENPVDDVMLGFTQDAPGKDIKGVPRPPDSVRMFNLAWSRGILNAYLSPQAAGDITGNLAQELQRAAWQPVLPELAQDDFLWFRKPGAEVLVWCNPLPEQSQTMVMMLAGFQDVDSTKTSDY